MNTTIAIEGYRIGSEITADGAICRIIEATRLSDNKSVIVKLAHASGMDIELRREFEQMSSFVFPVTPVPVEMTRVEGRRAIIFEDLGARQLDYWFARGMPSGVESFLTLATPIAKALDRLHDANLIHRNLCPESVLLNPDTLDVRFVGLYDPSIGPDENSGFEQGIRAYHDLAYISPEQTGRLRRQIDFRADYYSLGSIFYRMLTGQPLLRTDDPAEAIRRHVMGRPIAPSDLSRTPKMLSDIVMMLLEKYPENRYQSLGSLIDDLTHCWKTFQTDREIAPFPLGTTDVRDRFYISQRLYNRQDALLVLKNALTNTLDTRVGNIVVIEGEAGSGKSSLIANLYGQIAELALPFAHGRCLPSQQTCPYAVFSEAFDRLIADWSHQSEEHFSLYHQALETILGDGRAALVDVIPSLSAFIDPEKKLIELDSLSEQQRFYGAWNLLIKTISSIAGGFVCFIEDIDASDDASLALLSNLLIYGDLPNFLLVISCRRWPSTLPPLPDLTEPSSDDRTTGGASIGRLALSNLPFPAVRQLIADSLPLSRFHLSPLASAIYKKTQGNPKKTVQLLQLLYREKIVFFDAEIGQWQVDFDRLEDIDPDSVLEASRQDRLSKLTPETIETLQYAACIGPRFSLRLLAELMGEIPENLFHRIRPAIFNHILTILQDSRFQRTLQANPPAAISSSSAVNIDDDPCNFQSDYLFLKDWDIQFLLQTLPDEKKRRIHAALSRPLRNYPDVLTLTRARYALIAETTDNLRPSTSFIELALAGADQALRIAAYEAALDLLNAAVDHSELDSRDDLRWALETKGYEAAFLSGAISAAQEFRNRLIQSADSRAKRFELCLLQLLEKEHLGDFNGMIEIASPALSELGIALPENDSIGARSRALFSRLLGQIDEDKPLMLDNPEPTEDDTSLYQVRLLAALCRPLSVTSHRLYAYIVSSAFDLCFKTGVFPTITPIFASFAILCAQHGKIDAAKKVLDFGLHLAQIHHLPQNRLRTFSLLLIDHWFYPLKDPKASINELERLAIQEGDLAAMGLAHLAELVILFGTSRPVPRTLETIEEILLALTIRDHLTAQQFLLLFRQIYLALSGKTAALSSLDDDHFTEKRFEADLENHREWALVAPEIRYWVAKAYILFLDRAFEPALHLLEKGASHPARAGLIWLSVELQFFYGLTAAELMIQTTDPSRKAAYRAIVVDSLSRFDGWRKRCPANFDARHQVFVMICAMESEDLPSIFARWKDAFEACMAGGWLKEAAATQELFADYLIAKDLPLYALAHVIGAIEAYRQWQASAKVEMLTEQFRQMIGRRAVPYPVSLSHVLDTTIANTLISMAGRMLTTSGLSGLTSSLSQLLAQYGLTSTLFLVCQIDGQLIVETCLGVTETDPVHLVGQPIETIDPKLFPKALIGLAARLKRTLPWPLVSTEISPEAYIRRVNPASAIAIPLLYQDELIGAVYLENRTVPDLYNDQRRHLLDILVPMSALLIKNSLLTNHLQKNIIDLEERFKERSAGLSVLVTGVAHEVNTPIGNALTAASHIDDEITQLRSVASAGTLSKTRLFKAIDVIAEGVNITISNLRRAAELIRTFKQVSIEQTHEEKIQFDLVGYIRNLIDHLNPLLSQKPIKVDLNLPKQLIVESYPESFSQILSSLFVNAVAHAFESRDRGTISIDLSAQGTSIQLIFRDDGSGMPPDVRAKIFDPFATTKRGRGGSGLGAHIMYNLITQRLGGQIKCYSEPEKGTEFIIKVPINSP